MKVISMKKILVAGNVDSLPGLIDHRSCVFGQVDIWHAREGAREGETLLSAKDACSAALANGEVFA